MVKIYADPRLILLKTVCTALVLILGGSLAAAGVMGSDGCGMKCCCQVATTHVQTSAPVQMRSAMGCCAEDPLRPCDLQAAKPFELPEIILTTFSEDLSAANGLTANLFDSDGKMPNSGGNFVSQVLSPKFNSPPLYLQNVSFLI